MHRSVELAVISRVLGALLAIAALSVPGPVGAAGAAPVWETLPPTPALPPHTVGHRFDARGARLWYATWGRRSSRPPVLLLHGGLGNSNYFGYLIPALIERGWFVIAMDSRGHGRSTRGREPLSYHRMAADVIALLDRLHVRRIDLVGWSDGGCTGLDLALNHPERLAALFAFGAVADPSGGREGFDKTPAFAAYLERAPREYRELSPTPSGWTQFSAAMTRMWATLPDFTATELRSIRVPTMIADGEYDEVIKRSHDEYMAGTIPGARLMILAGVSHFAMLQNPAQFAAAVTGFLGRP